MMTHLLWKVKTINKWLTAHFIDFGENQSREVVRAMANF